MAGLKCFSEVAAQPCATIRELAAFSALAQNAVLPPSLVSSIHAVAAAADEGVRVERACRLAQQEGPESLPQVLELLGIAGTADLGEVRRRLEAECKRVSARRETLRSACLEANVAVEEARARTQRLKAENERLLRELAGSAAVSNQPPSLEQILAWAPSHQAPQATAPLGRPRRRRARRGAQPSGASSDAASSPTSARTRPAMHTAARAA